MWSLFWYVVSYIITDLLTPKPEVENAEAGALGDAPFPTASVDRPLPVVMGTTWVKGANTLWHGDIEIVPIEEEACSGTIFKKCTSYITGYKYFLGLQCGICHGPIDALLGISVAEDVVWAGTAVDETIRINSTEQIISIFGTVVLIPGENSDSDAVSGIVDVQSGTASQARNPYMVGQLGSDIPAYRGIACATFNKFFWGGSPTPGATGFLVKNIPTLLGTLHSDIGGQANPAHMIYELLVSTEFGSATPLSNINKQSFVTCAETLFNEGFGLKLKWESQTSVESIVTKLEKIVNAKLYPDYETGEIVLKLIRDDYVLADLPILDESNVIKFSTFSRPGWFETVNEVRVSYSETGAKDNTDQAGIAQDLGNLHMQQGQRVSTSLNYPQIPTAEVAAKVAQTELRQLSMPLSKCSLTVNRAGVSLSPGEVFILNRPSRGISNQIMRVGKWVEADISSSTITIDAIQDVYGLATALTAPAPVSSWVAPSYTPVDVVKSREDQLPYLLAVNDTNFNPTGVYTPQGIGWLFAASPNGISYNFDLLVDGVKEGIKNTFSSVGALPSVVGVSDTSVIVTISTVSTTVPTSDQSLGSTVICLGEELISYAGASNNLDGTYTLVGCERGLLDTVPVEHGVGADVWFDTFNHGVRPVTSYSTTAVVDFKYLPRTPSGQLLEADATNHSLTFTNRTARPYPVGNIKVSGASYGGIMTATEAVVSWAERNRLTQSDAIATQTAPTVTPEVGTTYTLKIYDRNDVLLRTEAGLTGTSYTYLLANELADTGLASPETRLTFTMQTIVGSLVSWQDQSITVYRDTDFVVHGGVYVVHNGEQVVFTS